MRGVRNFEKDLAVPTIKPFIQPPVREAVFVNRHIPDWEEAEDVLSGDDKVEPDRLTEAYVRVSDDLAYAQAYYGGSPTAAYLNDFTAGVHSRLYRNRIEERGRFLRFWAEEVPLAAWEARRQLALSAAVFVGALLLGL